MATIRRRDHEDDARCRSRRHEGAVDTPTVAPGIRICAICRNLVEEELIELPELFETCAYMLDLRPNRLRERVSGHRPRGIVLRDAVVSARSEILGVLAAWCGLVASERGVTGPNELDVRKLTAFLAIHLHWLCGHSAAPDLVDELTELSSTANEALRSGSGFRVAVGPCPHPSCTGTVYAEAHSEGGQAYEVSCEAGHVWAPEQWLSMWGGLGGDMGSSSQSSEGSE